MSARRRRSKRKKTIVVVVGRLIRAVPRLRPASNGRAHVVYRLYILLCIYNMFYKTRNYYYYSYRRRIGFFAQLTALACLRIHIMITHSGGPPRRDFEKYTCTYSRPPPPRTERTGARTDSASGGTGFTAHAHLYRGDRSPTGHIVFAWVQQYYT